MNTQEIIRNVEELSLREIKELIDNEGGKVEPRQRLEELLPQFLPRVFKFYEVTFTLIPRTKRHDVTSARIAGTSRVQAIEGQFIDQICNEIESQLDPEDVEEYGHLIRSSVMIAVDYVHQYFHVDRVALDEDIAKELSKIRESAEEVLENFFSELLATEKDDYKCTVAQEGVIHAAERIMNEILERYELVPRTE